MFFSAVKGLPAKLSVSCGEKTVNVEGPVPEAARNLAMDEEYVHRYLSKTGGTVYTLGKLKCVIGEGLMLPASALNKMRRDALDLL